MNFHPQARPRHLVIVLGDPLDDDPAGFDGPDPELDAVWMAEVAEESTHIWSHKARIAVFLGVMRHFRDALRQRSVTVHHRQLDEAGNNGAFVGELTATVQRPSPQKLIVVEPGEWRMRESLQMTALALGVDLEVRPDRHFLSTREEFAAHAKGRKQLRMESFYRGMRRKHNVLMDGGERVGGVWNRDADNRESFGKAGPGDVPSPVSFATDGITLEVLALEAQPFAKHPGSLAHFDRPVTPQQARMALVDFIGHRLPDFGKYEDAMWSSGDGSAAPLDLGLPDPSGVLHLQLPCPSPVKRRRTAARPSAAAPAAIRRDACPFPTLYWGFMLRHEKSLSKNQRMASPLKTSRALTRLNGKPTHSNRPDAAPTVTTPRLRSRNP